MYLAMLNEKQKQLFLGLAYYLTSIDGNYSIEEKKMMDSYCYEMQMDFNMEIVDRPIEDIMKEIQMVCGEKEKKIMVFEAIGLAMSDCNYDEDEKKFIYSMIERFGIEKIFQQQCETVLNEYIEFQNKINKMVIG